MSSRAALSRTDVVTAWCTEAGALSVEGTGKLLTRPRLGLRPTRPLIEAGIRIEPPPSLACATGTIPAPTAAAEPPPEPLGGASRRASGCQSLELSGGAES